VRGTAIIDHDRLFKELLSTFFVEFLELFFPDLSTGLVHDSVRFLDKEIFTDVTSGERYEADLVVQAQMRGQESFVLIHVEHQAQAQADFGRRMFRYFARLHDRYALPVYPIVLFSYARPRRPEPTVYRVIFGDWVILEFQYRVIQLNRLRWRDFVRRPNPIASALMAKMAIAPADRPRVKLECLRLLATLRLDPARTRLISGFIDTYLQLNAHEATQFETALAQLQEQEVVMEIVTSWMRQGIQQGKYEEALALVLRLLRRRVGPLDAADEEQIRRLSLEALEALSEALLDFTQVADVVTWLQAHQALS
jgi:hypothetical protein